MIREKVINNPNLLGVGVAQYLRVSRRCPTWDQNSIVLLEIDPIPLLGLDLIDPRSSLSTNCTVVRGFSIASVLANVSTGILS